MKNSFLFLCLLLFSCSKSSEPSLYVFHNFTGYTFKADSLISFSYLATERGKVIYVGNDSTQLPKSPTKRIDLNGKFVLPGLIDAHAHVMGLGYARLDVNLMGIKSLDSTLAKIESFSKKNPELQWVLGRGWNQTLWKENAFPMASDLDQIVKDKPVYLRRVDGHASWANSEAMRIAGISKETIDPDGGKIIRDKNGNPTGVFIDKAMNLVESKIPARTDAEKAKALELSLQEMAEMGLTGVHDAGISHDIFELYKQFGRENRLTTRIYAMIGGAGNDFDKIASEGLLKNYAQDRLYVQSVKLYEDGALGSRGAAMIHPYTDDPANFGLLFHDEAELTQLMLKVARKGYQVNTHAIGDKANQVVLNAAEKTIQELGLIDHRFRVEHAQIVHPEDIPRFKQLDVIASMQPTHATSDMNMAEDRVGPERIKGAYAWKTFLNQGTIVAAGSDFPVEESNPFFGLYSAVTRKDHNGMPMDGWYPEEKLTRAEALKAFTIDAAWAGFMQDVTGSLEVGKWADFIVIDRNYFSVDESEIWQTKVLQTWLAAEQVWKLN